MRASVALVALVLVTSPGRATGQAIVPPDTSELTLLGLDFGADSAEVTRVLGVPDSIRFYEHPFDVGARLQTWYYRHVWVFFNPQGRRDGMRLILPGLRTRRGLAVGDGVDRARALYGRPDEESADALRWGIGGRTGSQLVVEVHEGRLKSIFVGHIID
ncbi:MAG TPA: hypothetical protein VNL18_07925 [Gemmatimonadales bacterium]|nr:hypothetical protein [Gemmatimonadales bacterium]